jgi:hypothetical protein
MLNFYRPFFMSCFGRHFENGRHLEKEKLAKKKIRLQVLLIGINIKMVCTKDIKFVCQFTNWHAG